MQFLMLEESLPPLDHDNVIAVAGLNFSSLRAAGRACFLAEHVRMESLVKAKFAKHTSLYATFSNAPSRLPLTFQPRLPPGISSEQVQAVRESSSAKVPCLALSSDISRATSSNLAPSRSLVRASSFFECFSHCISQQNLAVIYSP